jgi:single-stranded-DNA-specific exonuclease
MLHQQGSVKGFDVYNALSLLWISRAIWWPHVHAAGMTLAPENYAAFKAAFEMQVRDTIHPDMRLRNRN